MERAMDTFSGRQFKDDEAARAYLEGLRWPSGPVCPHCGVIEHAYAIKPAGTYRCAEPACRKNFTVTMNTPMERSHIALHKWLQGFHLICSSKKGVSAHQLHRTLHITYRSAWFMAHRIRECMRTGGLGPMGGNGEIVEADETYYGPVAEPKKRKRTTGGREFTKGGHSGPSNKRPIVALVERGGEVRTFHVPVANQANVMAIVNENVLKETRLHTDESRLYHPASASFAHETVKHSAGEYVRGDVHTNSVEGYFSIFKRGMRGIYQHCGEKHLHRYLAEYDFRYNNRSKLGIEDGERTARAIKNATGKRLTYRQPH
jgi:transposase-like protein